MGHLDRALGSDVVPEAEGKRSALAFARSKAEQLCQIGCPLSRDVYQPLVLTMWGLGKATGKAVDAQAWKGAMCSVLHLEVAIRQWGPDLETHGIKIGSSAELFYGQLCQALKMAGLVSKERGEPDEGTPSLFREEALQIWAPRFLVSLVGKLTCDAADDWQQALEGSGLERPAQILNSE